MLILLVVRAPDAYGACTTWEVKPSHGWALERLGSIRTNKEVDGTHTGALAKAWHVLCSPIASFHASSVVCHDVIPEDWVLPQRLQRGETGCTFVGAFAASA